MEWLLKRARRVARAWRVRRLLVRCGAGAGLVIDSLLTCHDLLLFQPAAQVAGLARDAVSDAVVLLRKLPLWFALQDGWAAAADPASDQCRLCSPNGPLSVLGRSRSGSSAEGLADLFVGVASASDYDIMYELGGDFGWVAGAVAQAGAEPDRISTRSAAAPQLWAEHTSSAGFVTLHWVRTSRCLHKTPLPALAAHSVRRLMWRYCRAISPSDAEITTPGPAVNVQLPGQQHGGTDHVPCLRMPWWPDEQTFLSRHREIDFPPAARYLRRSAIRDICRFGVHLVPTGRGDGITDLNEWRVSFSRAEVVAIHHLTLTQRSAVKAVKRMKTGMKGSGAAPALKSYYIKTAALWLAQDVPIDRWIGVTDAVHIVLDWLESRLTAGSLPCFFWPDINLLADTTTDQLKNMTRTVRLMRRQATRLLMAWCEEKFYDLRLVLESGSRPLSERQLRLCLARLLIRRAVVGGLTYRPTASRWQAWSVCFIPALTLLSEHQLLDWRHHCDTGSYQQQCHLLQAMLVAPADLVGGARLEPLGGDMFTWDVTPLLDMLDESDLQYLLGDPAGVAAWCRQQLCRPPAERPAGLAAELDTPRGRADLLLQPELLLLAISEAVTDRRDWWQKQDQQVGVLWRANFPPLVAYEKHRQALELLLSVSGVLDEFLCSRLPEMDGPTVDVTARFWRRRLEHLLSDDRLRTKYSAITTRRADGWQLRQYAVLDEDSLQRDERGAAGGQQRRGLWEEDAEEECFNLHMLELVELERRHLLERDEIVCRLLQKRDEQERDEQERDEQERDEQQRDEQERNEQERDEQERDEQERDEQQRDEQERDEQQRDEQERDEQERTSAVQERRAQEALSELDRRQQQERDELQRYQSFVQEWLALERSRQERDRQLERQGFNTLPLTHHRDADLH